MNDYPYGICLSLAQVAGKQIGAVAHFLGQLKDLLPGLFTDHRVVFQGPAHRGAGNIQLAGMFNFRPM